MERLGRIAGRTALGLLLGVAAYFVIAGFFPRADLAIQDWLNASQAHTDGEAAGFVEAVLIVFACGGLGFVSAFVPLRKA